MAPAPAAIVFRGGTVWTADTVLPRAEAVAVRSGRIVFVGDAAGLDTLIGPDTEVVELAGRMLLPGFTDAHVHPISGGVELAECDLNAATTRSEVLAMVRECAERIPADAWVRGGGWQLPLFPGAAPTREALDSIVPDRPAYLSSADGHSAWVNSRALELADVDAASRPPAADGVIERRADGTPAGTLRESAMSLVSRHLPARTDAELRRGLARALAMAASYGITTLHEASADESFLRTYAEAERDGTLTARVVVALTVDPAGGTDQAEGMAELRAAYRGELVDAAAAKIFEDGVIEGGTAALIEPYLDRPGERGELNVAPDSLVALVGALTDAGFKIHVHAIGDRAIRVTLDALEANRTRLAGGPRPVIAHIQLWDPEDLPRFEELGVVADFQTLWAYADTYITDLTEPRLGPERSRWLYPVASVAGTGAILAAGSDWSVSSMNPFEAMEVAVTRRAPDADVGEAWIPEERVDLETILRAYTVGGAMAGDMEAETGSITVGRSADLAVVDRNVFDVAPTEISEAKVDLTLLRGRVVFRR